MYITCSLHSMNKLNLYGEKEEDDEFMVSLISSFMESKDDHEEKDGPQIPLILYVEPGSISVKNGTEFDIKNMN